MAQLARPMARPAENTVETYIRDINETPLLNAQEEKQLARRVEAGDTAARDSLVRANLRLVINIARRYAGRGLDLQDLIEEGNLGLLRAVEGFDPSMNTRFSTYASYWIKQSIKRALINTGRTIRIPAYMNELLIKWRRASAYLQEELGRTPTPEEIAKRLKLSKKKLGIIKKAILIHNASPYSDDGESSRPLEEMLTDVRARSADAGAEHGDDLRQVLGLLEEMDERSAAVLRLRFGLEGEDPKTLKEIGERLGLTRERVRQIEREALEQLRESIEVA